MKSTSLGNSVKLARTAAGSEPAGPGLGDGVRGGAGLGRWLPLALLIRVPLCLLSDFVMWLVSGPEEAAGAGCGSGLGEGDAGECRSVR